jgi:hypothetical protein
MRLLFVDDTLCEKHAQGLKLKYLKLIGNLSLAGTDGSEKQRV